MTFWYSNHTPKSKCRKTLIWLKIELNSCHECDIYTWIYGNLNYLYCVQREKRTRGITEWPHLWKESTNKTNDVLIFFSVIQQYSLPNFVLFWLFCRYHSCCSSLCFTANLTRVKLNLFWAFHYFEVSLLGTACFVLTKTVDLSFIWNEQSCRFCCNLFIGLISL